METTAVATREMQIVETIKYRDGHIDKKFVPAGEVEDSGMGQVVAAFILMDFVSKLMNHLKENGFGIDRHEYSQTFDECDIYFTNGTFMSVMICGVGEKMGDIRN